LIPPVSGGSGATRDGPEPLTYATPETLKADVVPAVDWLLDRRGSAAAFVASVGSAERARSYLTRWAERRHGSAAPGDACVGCGRMGDVTCRLRWRFGVPGRAVFPVRGVCETRHPLCHQCADAWVARSWWPRLIAEQRMGVTLVVLAVFGAQAAGDVVGGEKVAATVVTDAAAGALVTAAIWTDVLSGAAAAARMPPRIRGLMPEWVRPARVLSTRDPLDPPGGQPEAVRT